MAHTESVESLTKRSKLSGLSEFRFEFLIASEKHLKLKDPGSVVSMARFSLHSEGSMVKSATKAASQSFTKPSEPIADRVFYWTVSHLRRNSLISLGFLMFREESATQPTLCTITRSVIAIPSRE